MFKFDPKVRVKGKKLVFAIVYHWLKSSYCFIHVLIFYYFILLKSGLEKKSADEDICMTQCVNNNSCMEIRDAKLFEAAKSMFKS